MIIKMTFHDNYFTDKLENFARKLIVELSICDNSRKIIPILNEDYENVSKEDEGLVIQEVVNIFNRLFSFHKSFDYLKRHFEVTIVKEITEEWFNGEVVFLSTKASQIMTF